MPRDVRGCETLSKTCEAIYSTAGIRELRCKGLRLWRPGASQGAFTRMFWFLEGQAQQWIVMAAVLELREVRVEYADEYDFV